MAAAGCFDQWQKDAFFNAAEEVQESADLMESVYRAWVCDRSNGVGPEILDELHRELHTALGTAKWQLEQFERAVRSSDNKYSLEESTIARRRQFIVAIEDQIARVEKALNDSLVDYTKEGFYWVKLDEEERDDLVAFLSAPPQLSQETKKTSSQQKNLLIAVNGHSDTVAVSTDSRHQVDIAPQEISNGKDDACGRVEQPLSGQRRALSYGDDSYWKIDVADEKDEDSKPDPKRVEMASRVLSLSSVLRRAGSMTRLRWFRNSLWKAKNEEHLELRHDLTNYLDFRGTTLLAQRFNRLTERSRSCFSSWKENSRLPKIQLSGRVGGLQHIQGPQCNSPFGRSLRITLLLVLSLFLIVPFVLYSA